MHCHTCCQLLLRQTEGLGNQGLPQTSPTGPVTHPTNTAYPASTALLLNMVVTQEEDDLALTHQVPAWQRPVLVAEHQ